jgi:hypothetical protein
MGFALLVSSQYRKRVQDSERQQLLERADFRTALTE